MATYKRITDVETVAEATENMNVLVEDNGALKKMPVGNTGGNGERIIFYLDAETGTVSCNHTYQEVYDMYFSPISNFVDSNNFKDLNEAPSNLLVDNSGRYLSATMVAIPSNVSTLAVAAQSITFYFYSGTYEYIYFFESGDIEYSGGK